MTPISPLGADGSTRNPWELASPADEAVSDSGNRVLVTVSAQHDHGLKRSVGKGWTVAVNASRELCQDSLDGKVVGRKYQDSPSHAPERPQPPLGPVKGISRGLTSHSHQYPRQPAAKRLVGSKVQVGSRNSSMKQQRLAPPRKKNIIRHKPKNTAKEIR